MLRIVHGVQEFYVEKYEQREIEEQALKRSSFHKMEEHKAELRSCIHKARLSIASTGGTTEGIDAILNSGVFPYSTMSSFLVPGLRFLALDHLILLCVWLSVWWMSTRSDWLIKPWWPRTPAPPQPVSLYLHRTALSRPF